MRLLARMTRLDGQWVEAAYAIEAAITAEQGGLLLVNGKPVPPATARNARYEILEVNSAEAALLGRCAYRFLLEQEAPAG
jgi:hypothetical protein